MSHRIVGKRELGPDVFWVRIEAPLIAQARQPGQFIILSISNDYSERIPLTIAGADPADGTIELIWQRVGKTTAELANLNEGDEIANVSGPLGTPTRIANFGTVVCVGGGIGAAPLLPIATALKDAGNRVVSILGFRSKDRLILEEEFARISDELVVTTDDGSYARKALVTEPLAEVCGRDPKPGHAFIIGPTIMMKFCCGVTKKFEVPTQSSLNTIMIDGTACAADAASRSTQAQVRLRRRARIRRAPRQFRPDDQTHERLQAAGAAGVRAIPTAPMQDRLTDSSAAIDVSVPAFDDMRKSLP
jgi:ferredoxin--NADP+ reductase